MGNQAYRVLTIHCLAEAALFLHDRKSGLSRERRPGRRSARQEQYRESRVTGRAKRK